MSEEILDALTRLFAMITMQEGGATEVERNFVVDYFKKALDQDTLAKYLQKYDEISAEFRKGKENEEMSQEELEKAFMKFSVRVLKACKEINKTLEQKQKVLVLVKMLELVASDQNLSPKRMEVIETAAAQLQLKPYYEIIKNFVLKTDDQIISSPNVLTVSSQAIREGDMVRHIHVDNLQGNIIFLRVKDVDMHFVKYTGHEAITLNGFVVKQNEVHLFSTGSIIKTPKGYAFYYSDITNIFLSGFGTKKISFHIRDVEFKFPNGTVALRDINLSEGGRKLIGIMGASGAGKTTLLNVLSGIEKPAQGEVLINGINVHEEKDKLQGVIGYVAQDDLLIEELTVYQNLYYNTKLTFKDFNQEQLHERVMEVLNNLNLVHIKDLKVGNVLSKKISGGQRKRLNIALELVREPALLFLDEPTSGLSSRDSENVMDLLKELSLKGKLIFVVIHQPSSEIYKMFDKLLILDTGGYPTYYGNPIEAVVYFKKVTNQVNSEVGQCFNCGNVNPEQIFDIIEDRVVDEYGKYSNKRKITPKQWYQKFKQNFEYKEIPVEQEAPPKALDLPNKLRQLFVFTTRDFLAKISNKQYLLLNLLEAPILATLLALIIRFQNAPTTGGYVYRYNDNIPAYILMTILVALFMGLTVSAEEIIRDRKIQKREAFLNLSRHSYLLSKVVILFTLSAIQTLSFAVIGNLILEIQGITFAYWLVLFTVSCASNLLGLNISATFNSVVTIYITIPLLLIPQMILSGAIFSFDKLNHAIGEKGKVPLLADIVFTRWAFEALAVYQYKDNAYQKPYYKYEKEESKAFYKEAYWTPTMKNILQRAINNINPKNDSLKKQLTHDLTLIRTEINKDTMQAHLKNKAVIAALTPAKFTEKVATQVDQYLDTIKYAYTEHFNKNNKIKEAYMGSLETDKTLNYSITRYMNAYFNESLAELVKNTNYKDKVLEYKGELLQQMDPIFLTPTKPTNPLNYRTHFFAPQKPFLGKYWSTYGFNILVLWGMTIFLYFTLYFDIIKRISNQITLFRKKKEK